MLWDSAVITVKSLTYRLMELRMIANNVAVDAAAPPLMMMMMTAMF